MIEWVYYRCPMGKGYCAAPCEGDEESCPLREPDDDE